MHPFTYTTNSICFICRRVHLPINYPNNDQPFCNECRGVGYWTFECQVDNAFATFSNDIYETNNNRRIEPQPNTNFSCAIFECSKCGRNHLSSNCNINYYGGPSSELTNFSTNFCRKNMYESYAQSSYTFPTTY